MKRGFMKRGSMKRSQVALEFLVTYGWAILASMIAIGALAYFGISNPAKTLPDKCLFSNEVVCSDYIVIAPDQLKIKLVNGMGQTVYNPGAVVINASGDSNQCNINPSAPSDWAPDDILDMTCTVVGSQFIQKDKVKIKLIVNYSKTPSGYNQIASGELYTTVQ